jgi:hypothetical protein
MLNCEQATRLISEGQDRDLGSGERTLLRLHTWMCTGCRQFKGQVGFIRQAMKGFASQAPLEGGEPGQAQDEGTDPRG